MRSQAGLKPACKAGWLPVAMAASLALAAASSANGQQVAAPTTKPPTQARKPAALPAEQSPTTESSGEAPQERFVFFPWTKICNGERGSDNTSKEVCLVATEGYLETGQLALTVTLIEAKNDTRKVLRVGLPLGMQLKRGTRVILDQGAPEQRPYLMCLEVTGCVSDYEANAEIVEKLKNGRGLTVQAISPRGEPLSLMVPLTRFASAYDGPPIDPKLLETERKDFQDGFQRRADQSRAGSDAGRPGAAHP